MKKAYTKPSLEVEVYQLNAALAAGCTYSVSMGPGTDDGVYPTCDEYGGSFDPLSIVPGGMGVMSVQRNSPFYDDQGKYCDCYYTSGGIAYITS